jgi:hypothetical protein
LLALARKTAFFLFLPHSKPLRLISQLSEQLALTEVDVQGVLTGIYSQTGQFRDFDLLCGTALKRAFTNLTYTTPSSGSTNTQTAVRTLNREADASADIASVDIFEGDFGKLRLHPSHFLKLSSGAGNTFVGYVIPFD